MIQFQRVTPALRDTIAPLLMASGRRGAEYSFANLCMWGRQECAVEDGVLLLFSHYDGRSMYPFPVGQGDLHSALERIMADSRKRGIPCRLAGLTPADRQELERLYPGKFRFHISRDSFDYLYRIEDLATLKGKKFQQKRNHMNRFDSAHPDASLRPLEGEVLEEAKVFVDRWFAQRLEQDPTGDYQLEQTALRRAFRCFDHLGLEGLALYVDGQVIAITMGSFINEQVFDVHFEKGDPQLPESYAAINRGFARHLMEKYPTVQFLNREDDMGLPGLRKAKLSYNPVELVEKCWAVLAAEDE